LNFHFDGLVIPAKTQKIENSNLHGFEVHRPLSKGTKLLLQVIKSIIHPSVRATIFVFSITTHHVRNILRRFALCDDGEEGSLKMPSWLTAVATQEGARGLAERVLLRPFGPCICCTH